MPLTKKAAEMQPTKRNYSRLSSDLKERLKQNYRMARALPEFLRRRVTVEQANEEIKKALENRAERFLELMQDRVYVRPDSPYLKLLKTAGCEFSDLQARVRRCGLEATLEELANAGVYLTVEEFKGKKEVRRGKESFRVSAQDFAPPTPSPGFMTQSTGTNNAPVRSIISLDRIAIQALEVAIFFSAHGLLDRSHAMYDAILPAGGGMRNLLINAKLGITTDRWFARKVPTKTFLGRCYQYWSTYLIVMMGKGYGPGFPRPEFIDTGDMGPIVRWVSEKRLQGKTCCIKTAASNAARIARAAGKLGISLAGTKFIVGGEPFTEAKRETIHRAGAAATVHYGFSAGGSVGNGCADPLYADEVHINQHTFAVIPHPKPLNNDGPPIRPLLFTTLLPTDPRLLLNVENGDYGILEERDCGCALQRAGLTGHLRHIRSYEKFTSEGMNYFYGDLFDTLEMILPAEFGGGPGDYQLLEEEDERGQTRLTLRVHPDIANLDEGVLLRRLEEELAKGSWGHEWQAKIWREAGTFRIKREVPYSSPRGKILPLHISRS
jgi:hypothetical protein